jgi:hypothetical protein
MLWHLKFHFEYVFPNVMKFKIEMWDLLWPHEIWGFFFLMLWSLKLQFDVCSNDFKFETETWGLFLTFYLL